ncbi:MAG: hypothetical protein LBI64_07585 [Coriobacteriales bacterium]|jgi:hypothetical protein|nr:hypothetical protein [Coriobacteriales bacterium]
MIKQQIVMDTDRVKEDGKYDLGKIQRALDEFMTAEVGFSKAPDGFYIGQNRPDDFARAGYAMTTLREKPWFMRYVKTWLHFNSDDSDDPSDFAIEDFKEFNYRRFGLSA